MREIRSRKQKEKAPRSDQLPKIYRGDWISDLLMDKTIQKMKRREKENNIVKDTTYGKIKANNAIFLKNSQVEIFKRMEITQS